MTMPAIKGATWKLEVGVKPDPSRFDGFDKTETFRLFADTHNKAVEIMKKYREDFNADYIVKSEREIFHVIVDFPEV
jgi:hypothetical protein